VIRKAKCMLDMNQEGFRRDSRINLILDFVESSVLVINLSEIEASLWNVVDGTCWLERFLHVSLLS
jgi:hypothetical protein